MKKSRPTSIMKHNYSMSYSCPDQSLINSFFPNGNYDEKKLNPHINAKGAGIIPYIWHNSELKFLLQRHIFPDIKKKRGWNDFGGKKEAEDSGAMENACREFAEETSCLFYLINKDEKMYNIFKNNNLLQYSQSDIKNLTKIIPYAKQYFLDKLGKFPQYICCGETYITYFLEVDYLDINDIPKCEDIFKDYETKYIRECKWVDAIELINLEYSCFSKRLQIMNFQNKIKKMLDKRVF